MCLSEPGEGRPRRRAGSRASLPEFPATHAAAPVGVPCCWGGQEGRDVHGTRVTSNPREPGAGSVGSSVGFGPQAERCPFEKEAGVPVVAKMILTQPSVLFFYFSSNFVIPHPCSLPSPSGACLLPSSLHLNSG